MAAKVATITDLLEPKPAKAEAPALGPLGCLRKQWVFPVAPHALYGL